ncbi:MAG: hypothetical protein AB7G75_17110 [Candidatus Binatia bacterium]
MTNRFRLPSPVRFVLRGALTIILSVAGCAGKTLSPYPRQAASSYPYFQEQDGLAIGIKPLTDPQESEKYFHTDLLSRGILAIFVAAENRESPNTFLLLKGQFTLHNALREELQVSDREQAGSSTLAATQNVMSALAVVGYFGFYGVGALPFALVESSIESHEEQVKTKFVTEELQAKTISLGEGTHGFVYFRRPPGYPASGYWVLRVEAMDVTNQKTKIFDFILDKK